MRQSTPRRAGRTPLQGETRRQAEGKTLFQEKESRRQPGSGNNVHAIPEREQQLEWSTGDEDSLADSLETAAGLRSR